MKSSIFPLDHGSNKLMKSEYFLHFFIKKENKEKFTKKREEDRRKKKSDYYLLPEKFFYYTNSNTLKSISSKQNRFHMTLTKTKRTISQTKCDYKIRKENLYTFEAKGVHEDLGKVILQNKKILFKPVKLCKSMTLPSLKPREPTPKPKHHRKTKIPIRIQLSTDDEVFEYMKIAM